MIESEVQPQRAARPDARGRWSVLWSWTRVAPVPLALLVAAHLAFGIARFPIGSLQKRHDDIAEWRELGADAWSFRLADDETRRIARWLKETVRPDQLVAWDGDDRGSMQLLAPLLFPALLVDARARAAWPAGREPFAARAPWVPAAEGQLPVVVASREALRLEYR